MAKAKVVTNLDAHASTGENARIIAKTRLEEMYGWEEYVDDPYSIHELHNLRIAAKRLRYTLEIFAETFPEQREEVTREVEQIQEELGSLHDSDVMIALLRLCLGVRDSGPMYEHVLRDVAERSRRGKFMLNPALVSYTLDPRVTPSSEEREGLELILNKLTQQREEQYMAFREHWYQLKGRDFRREVVALLESSL